MHESKSCQSVMGLENDSQAFTNVTVPPCLGHPATAGIACASLLASTSGVDVGENGRA